MTARPTVMLAWSHALCGASVPSPDGTTLLVKADTAATAMPSKEPRITVTRLLHPRS
ncbi:MAG: hypothetical protein H7066_19160 [Cytophagaceae bacterium]|nr:hypothetical protein [Gemmatimonadaceae bacterium]